MWIGGPAVLVALAALDMSGCGSGDRSGPAATSPVVTAPPAQPPAPGAVPPPDPAVVEVPYRVERRTSDAATAGFAAVVEATLSDPRGWSRAGFRMVRRDDAAFLIVLAEGPEVDRLCLPFDTYGLYSCQNGPVVALNADRWRVGTPEWTGDLATYRRMLVNHEVGHLLGQRHPPRQCPRQGRPAPVMAQQSTELNGCLPNPWPLPERGRGGRPPRPAIGAPVPQVRPKWDCQWRRAMYQARRQAPPMTSWCWYGPERPAERQTAGPGARAEETRGIHGRRNGC